MKANLLRVMTCSLLVLTLAIAGSVAALAQSNVDGAIGGTVTDQTHAVVAGAAITVRNLETNAEFSGTSNTAGVFNLAHLVPGTYSVQVTSGSFSPFKATQVVVELGRVTNLDVKLTVGTAVEVEVTGEAPVINTVQADFSHNMNTTALNDLPINMRRWSSFAMLTPGAVPDGPYGLVAFRGISGLLNSNTVDGGDNNNAFYSEERGRTRATATISQDSIREFQVNNSNFSAEFGRAAGGVVNAVTKSGTNNFHGTGRLFATDSAMWAANPLVPAKPDDRRYQYGGNLGGPIVKDKLFFFFNYDQQKENAPGMAAYSAAFGAPITAKATTNCSTKAGNTTGQLLWCRFNQNLISSTAATVTPKAETVSAATVQAFIDKQFAFLQSTEGPVARRKDQYSWFPKIDWVINGKNTLTANWNHMRWNSPGGVQTAAVVPRADWGDDLVDVDTGNLHLTSVLSNTMVNEFRTSIGREDQYQVLTSPLKPGEPTTNALGLSPEINISGSGGWVFGQPYYTDRKHNPQEWRYQFADSMSKTFDRHIFKFGFDFNRTTDLVDYLYQNGGVYSYSNIADWLSDSYNPHGLCTGPNSGGTNVLMPCYNYFAQGFGPTNYNFATRDYSAFLQDEFHASRKLTVNLGVRYEYESLPDAFWPNAALPQSSVRPHDHFDIGPRGGFAYDLTGDGKTVIRGGYGIYYGRIANSLISGTLSNTGSLSGQIATGQLKACQIWDYTTNTAKFDTGCKSGAAPAAGYPNVLPDMQSLIAANKVPKPAPTIWGPTVKSPMVHEADFVIEREIAHNTVVSVSYLMSMGRRLPFNYDSNIAATTLSNTFTYKGGPQDGQTITVPFYTSRINSAFGQIYAIDYIAKSRYDGFVAQINRRMTRGLQFQASYTHGRTTDWNQNTGTGGSSNQPLDPYNFRLENGTSGFDIRHRFVGMAVWQPEVKGGSALVRALVNGFNVAPIVTISSGAPQNYNVSVSGTVSSGSTSGLTSCLLATGGGSCRMPGTARNSYVTPTLASSSMRVSRRFKIVEGKNLEFMGEAFNLTNHFLPTVVTGTLYQLKGTTLNYCGVGSASGLCDSSLGYVGQVTSANNQDRISNSVRQFQVGVRFSF